MRFGAVAVGGVAALLTTIAAADLAVRPTKFVWDKGDVLRGTFSFTDVLDNPAVKTKHTKGTIITVVMRGYILPNGGGDPIALTAHTCTFVWDLWNDVFRVSVDGGPSKVKINMKGVYKECTELVDHPIVERFRVKANPAGYYLAVKAEVNPTDAKKLAQIKAWVTRPAGATGGISLGDALFASFVGLFMKDILTADAVVDFRTPSFPK